MGSLGQHEEQGEEIGQPEIVGSDGGVVLRGQLALVYETPGGLPLKLGSDVGGAVDPTIGPRRSLELIYREGSAVRFCFRVMLLIKSDILYRQNILFFLGFHCCRSQLRYPATMYHCYNIPSLR